MGTNRREFIAGTGAVVAVLANRRALAATGASSAVDTLLADIAEAMLADYPENTTTLGIDNGARAPLKARLTDRSAAGQAAIAARVAKRIERMRAVDTAKLDEAARTDLDVLLTAHETAAEGFKFPYGDVALLNQNWSWRNAPYVVAQNTGAFLEIPNILVEQHSVANREDADAYLARLESYAAQLDGETGRLHAAAAQGVIAPDFLLDKTLTQARIARGGQRRRMADGRRACEAGEGERVARASTPLRRRRSQRARSSPALDRQIAELEAHRQRATADAGVWKLPQGDAYYAWTLRASTTTRMTPDEIHDRGREELAALQSEMDAILKKQGLTQGSVGERMTALGKDPRFLYPDDDTGRARILAYLQEIVADIRARLPRAFATPTPGVFRDQAHGARSRAGRARRLRRPGQHRRQEAGHVLDQPRHDGALDHVQPADADLSRVAAGPRLAGRVRLPPAAGAVAACVQCVFGRLGALRRAARGRTWRL